MLITEEYKDLQRRTHEDIPEWGRAAAANIEPIREYCKVNGIKELLDYGCGKQRLRDGLKKDGIVVYGYDPGIPGLDSPPNPCGHVACLDVLEHVEPECIDAVLDDLRRVIRVAGLLTIATTEAKTLLSDGTNAHRTIKPMNWWLDKLKERFNTVHVFIAEKQGFGVAVQ